MKLGGGGDAAGSHPGDGVKSAGLMGIFAVA